MVCTSACSTTSVLSDSTRPFGTIRVVLSLACLDETKFSFCVFFLDHCIGIVYYCRTTCVESLYRRLGKQSCLQLLFLCGSIHAVLVSSLIAKGGK